MSMIPGFYSRGIGFMFIMLAHLQRCHPFAEVSQFDPAKGDMKQSNLYNSSQTVPPADTSVIYGRENDLIIDNSPRMGSVCKYALKRFTDESSGLNVQVMAVTLRERGTKNFSKILRFVYFLPASLSNLIMLGGCTSASVAG